MSSTRCIAGDVVLPSSEIRGKFLPLHLKMIVVAALAAPEFLLSNPLEYAKANI